MNGSGEKNEGSTHDFRGSTEDRDDDVGAGAVGMEGNRGAEGPGWTYAGSRCSSTLAGKGVTVQLKQYLCTTKQAGGSETEFNEVIATRVSQPARGRRRHASYL